MSISPPTLRKIVTNPAFGAFSHGDCGLQPRARKCHLACAIATLTPAGLRAHAVDAPRTGARALLRND